MNEGIRTICYAVALVIVVVLAIWVIRTLIGATL